MRVKIVVLIITCCSISAIRSTNDYCGKCSSASGVKCIDETTFAFCDQNGFATNRLASCPSDMKCVNNRQICAKVENGACQNKCKRCLNGRFTCITRNAFSLCFGRNQTSTVAARCEFGKVCSTARFDPKSSNPSINFCFDEILLDHHEIDCDKPEIPAYVPTFHPLGPAKPPYNMVLPTPSHPYPAITEPAFIDEPPASYCSRKKPGKYQIRADGTCQRYYVCYHNGKEIVGDIFTCAAHSVYDPTVQKCVRPTAGFYTLYKCGASARVADMNNEESNLKSPYINISPMSRSFLPNSNDYTDLAKISSGTPVRAGGRVNRKFKSIQQQNSFSSTNNWNPFNHSHPISPPVTSTSAELPISPVVHQQGYVIPLPGYLAPDGLMPTSNDIPPIQENAIPMPNPGFSSWFQGPQMHLASPTNYLQPIQPYQNIWNWG